MTVRDMQISFEIECNLHDPTEKPTSIEIVYWLNQAIEKFYKTRYSGVNPKGESFEQTQKRIDDLRTLVKEVTITTSAGTNKPNSYIATLPADYRFALGEEVTIQYTKNGSTVTSREGVTKITIDRYREEIDNNFSEFRLQHSWARPLRLFYNVYVELVSDGMYSIPTYYLRYLAKPTAIALPNTSSNLPEHTHTEIVKLAVEMYLENVKDPRIQTYQSEIITME